MRLVKSSMQEMNRTSILHSWEILQKECEIRCWWDIDNLLNTGHNSQSGYPNIRGSCEDELLLLVFMFYDLIE